MAELVGKNARERLTAVKRGLRSILDLIGQNGETREFRLSPPSCAALDGARIGGQPRERRRRAARRTPAQAPSSRRRSREVSHPAAGRRYKS